MQCAVGTMQDSGHATLEAAYRMRDTQPNGAEYTTKDTGPKVQGTGRRAPSRGTTTRDGTGQDTTGWDGTVRDGTGQDGTRVEAGPGEKIK